MSSPLARYRIWTRRNPALTRSIAVLLFVANATVFLWLLAHGTAHVVNGVLMIIVSCSTGALLKASWPTERDDRGDLRA